MQIDFSITQLIYLGVLPAIAWAFKVLVINRLEKLEEKVETMVNEVQVRQIISDKIDPVQQDLREIKSDLKHLFVLQLTDKARNDLDQEV